MASKATHWKDMSFVTFDLETTSLNPEEGEIIEVGIVRFDKGKVVDTYNQLVAPYNPVIPEKTTEITGITAEDLVGQPHLDQILDDIMPRLTDIPIVAYNLPFDKGFLTYHIEKFGRKWPKSSPLIDAFVIAQKLLPRGPGKTLSELCKRFEIDLTNAHRASHDAEATGFLLLKFADHFADELPSDINKLADTLYGWGVELERERARWRGNRGRSNHMFTAVPVGLGKAFTHGSENDHLRALYLTVPQAPDEEDET